MEHKASEQILTSSKMQAPFVSIKEWEHCIIQLCEKLGIKFYSNEKNT